jgi:hypothetical protein
LTEKMPDLVYFHTGLSGLSFNVIL